MSCSDDDIERIGKARYAELRPRMEAEHWGKMVVIDVHSGDYEIGSDDETTTDRLLERRPDAMTWGERVGYPAPYFMYLRPNILPLGPNTEHLMNRLPQEPGNNPGGKAGQTMPCADDDDDDIARIGKAMYAELRPQMEADHWGKMVVIDIYSGDYEIGDGDESTTDRLLARRPDAITWGERVGYPAPYFMYLRPNILPLGPNTDHLMNLLPATPGNNPD